MSNGNHERLDRDDDIEHARDAAAVSRAFRAVATEVTPAHLDHQVLALAARPRRGLASRLREWQRPVAYAAVVVIGLGMALEWAGPWRTGSRGEPAADAIGREFRLKNAPATEQAEAIMDLTSGDSASPDRAAVDPAAASPGAPAGRYCDSEATATADTWLACIAALEASGSTDAADSERAHFELAYPEFPARPTR